MTAHAVHTTSTEAAAQMVGTRAACEGALEWAKEIAEEMRAVRTTADVFNVGRTLQAFQNLVGELYTDLDALAPLRCSQGVHHCLCTLGEAQRLIREDRPIAG